MIGLRKLLFCVNVVIPHSIRQKKITFPPAIITAETMVSLMVKKKFISYLSTSHYHRRDNPGFVGGEGEIEFDETKIKLKLNAKISKKKITLSPSQQSVCLEYFRLARH